MGLRAIMHRAWERCVRFTQRQGLAIVTTVCVAVITGTAVWTGRSVSDGTPLPTTSGDVSAARLMQQTLPAATASPTPVPSPAFRPPLETLTLLHPFSMETMVRSGVTGIWRIHDAVDLQASDGEDVLAIADGEVLACSEDALAGGCLVIAHEGGVRATYAGLAALADLSPGDQVRAGYVIGQAGNGMADEADLGAHLHLRVTLDGHAIDPMGLFGAE